MSYLTRGRGNGKSILFLIENHERLIKYCAVLEKALDRACFELEYSNKQLRNLDKSFIEMTEKDWKELLLKDE